MGVFLWILLGVVTVCVEGCGNQKEQDEKGKDSSSDDENLKDIFENVKETEIKEEQTVVEFAEVTCTSCENNESDILFILDNEGNKVELAGISQLTKVNTKMINEANEDKFKKCQITNNNKCPGAEIQNDVWKAVNTKTKLDIDRETLNKEESYMICEVGYGVIYFVNGGQALKSFAESKTLELIPDTPLYNYTKMMLGNVTSFSSDFDKERRDFNLAYERNKAVYDSISQKAGIPPELLAIIHYREGTNDYLEGKFNIYLHNGEELGTVTKLHPEGKLFYTFEDAAVDAVRSQNSSIEKYHLTAESKDIIAMMCFAEAYNGLGYYNNDHVSPYIYSGTNVYTFGKYVEEFDKNGKRKSVYKENLVDQQVGAYLLINDILDE